MAKLALSGHWVVITGASSGLGEAMAHQLAAQQVNLVLVARRAPLLEALAAQLGKRHGIRCQVVAADLSQDEEVVRVFEAATRDHPIKAVILNAGITHFGEHLKLSWSQFQTLLATNVSSVVRLTNLFVPHLRDHAGAVMLVASMAGLTAVPFQSAYAGSKAFITNFGMSLAEELRGQGVSMTVFAPGGIATPMTHDSDLRYFENTALMQSAEQCAKEGLTAMVARKRLLVPGRLNRMQLFMTRLVPRRLAAALTANAYRRALNASASQEASE